MSDADSPDRSLQLLPPLCADEDDTGEFLPRTEGEVADHVLRVMTSTIPHPRDAPRGMLEYVAGFLQRTRIPPLVHVVGLVYVVRYCAKIYVDPRHLQTLWMVCLRLAFKAMSHDGQGSTRDWVARSQLDVTPAAWLRNECYACTLLDWDFGVTSAGLRSLCGALVTCPIHPAFCAPRLLPAPR